MSGPEQGQWHLARAYGYLAALWLVVPLLLFIPGPELSAAARAGSSLAGAPAWQGALGVAGALVLVAWLGALALGQAMRIDEDGPLAAPRWLRPIGLLGAALALLPITLAIGWLPALAGATIDRAQADSSGLAIIGILGLCAVAIGVLVAAAWELEHIVRRDRA